MVKWQECLSWGRGREIGPRDEKNTSHTHTNGAATERVARVGCKQYGINAKCCRRTENGTDVRGVYHSMYDGYPAGFGWQKGRL